jgi:hypothetical protein
MKDTQPVSDLNDSNSRLLFNGEMVFGKCYYRRKDSAFDMPWTFVGQFIADRGLVVNSEDEFEYRFPTYKEFYPKWDKDIEYFSRLVTENIALRKDEARLDWLEMHISTQETSDLLSLSYSQSHSIRAAIDAAMGKEANP